MIVLIAIVCVYAAIILPISLTFNLNYSSEKKEVRLCVSVYGALSVINAKIEPIKQGIVIRFSSGKTKTINLLSLKNIKSSIKIFRDFHIVKAKLFILRETDNVFSEYLKFYIFNYVINMIIPIIKYNKPYLKAESEALLTEGEDKLDVHAEAHIFFNLLVVIMTFIKSLWGKIYGK